jgi:DNA-damage-inducible protein J
MQGADVVRARIDPDLKRQATEVLDEMGLSLSDAIRLLFVRIAADRAMPFEVRAPNKQTIAALEESERGGLPAFQSIEALMADLNDGKD